MRFPIERLCMCVLACIHKRRLSAEIKARLSAHWCVSFKLTQCQKVSYTITAPSRLLETEQALIRYVSLNPGWQLSTTSADGLLLQLQYIQTACSSNLSCISTRNICLKTTFWWTWPTSYDIRFTYTITDFYFSLTSTWWLKPVMVCIEQLLLCPACKHLCTAKYSKWANVSNKYDSICSFLITLSSQLGLRIFGTIDTDINSRSFKLSQPRLKASTH